MPESLPDKITFQFIKGNDYRVLHVDGANGGVTPRGGIFVSFYSERRPIPESVTHAIGPDGMLGEEIASERKVKPGVIREVEVGIIMDEHVAQSFHQWLGDMIGEFLKLKEATEKVRSAAKDQHL